VTEVFDPEAILRVLSSHGVDFVVVGGVAVQAHGYIRGTQDVDIVPQPRIANLSRLGEALAELGARPWRSAERVDVTDPQLLKRAALVPVITDFGRLDVINIASAPGLSSDYSAVRERSVESTLHGMRVVVVSLDDLIRMKRFARRDQDLIDIRALTALDEDLAREAGEST
jgi:predicted nucleotidyltransferase